MLAAVLKDLFDRRVPHILGGYMAVAWGVIEFVTFLEGRLMFSPHWAMLVLTALALLVPSVALVAYNHGRPGKDQWLKAEKVAIPVNLFAAAAVLFLTFGGRDLGAVTTTVTVENEEGEEVERVIPKAEFRKRLALFHFEPGDDDASELWYGLGEALRMDLYQDMFLEVVPALAFQEDAKRAGFEGGYDVPFQLRRQLAGERNLDFLVDGEVVAAGDSVVATARVHEVERGKVVDEITVRAADLFEAADFLSVAIRKSVEVPAAHIEESVDLPSRDMFTESDAAFRSYLEALRAIEFDDDWAGAVAALEEAVRVDPTFAVANMNLYLAAMFSQRFERGRVAIQNAKQHSYKLPERLQYDVRYADLYAQQRTEESIQVLETKAELFPQDVEAQEQLAMMSQLQGDREKAIGHLERALELAPAKTEHLQTIAGIHSSLGDFDTALEYLNRYAEAHPDDASSYTRLGDVHRRMGRLDEAREQYEMAVTVDDNPELVTNLALVERATGDFDAALARLEQRLEAANTPSSRASALGVLGDFYVYRGQMAKALEHYGEQLSILSQVAPPLIVLDTQSEILDVYVHAGLASRAQQIVAGIKAQLGPPLDVLTEFMVAELAIAMGDAATAEAAADRAEQAFELFPLESERDEFLELLGEIAELKGDCETAIRHWTTQGRLDPTNPEVPGRIGRCHRQLGDLDQAEKALNRTLSLVPSHPRARYELALVLDARGDRQGAIRELERALGTWAEADDTYRIAREARDTHASWKGMLAEG